jgi:two-component system, OmpR family, phosphate regulon sensor histidine kinase PhoR
MNYSRTELNHELENYRRQISELQMENEELIKSLHVVNEKLCDSERLKGHFISNITNEIINPFASILALAGNIQQLKEGEIQLAHRMASLIFEEAFHLDFQLHNIFAVALIEAGKEELKIVSFNLKDFGDNLHQYFNEQLQQKNILFSVNFTNESESADPFKFSSDYEKLDLIVKNLISNSIKYSSENSTITVEFICGNGILTLEVSDYGKGINPEDRKIVFDRFKQLDEKINSINTGHGLGLSIVLAYTDMLGGKVSLKENFEGGTRVTVSIPECTDPDDWDDLEGFLLDSATSY